MRRGVTEARKFPMGALNSPVLSVVVAIVSDTTWSPDSNHLGPCLAALKDQSGPPTLEIIVPHLPSVAGISRLREQYPDVRFLEVAGLRSYSGRRGSREHHDELRARGLALARGHIVALIEDHGIPARDWCARIVESHRLPAAAVGGAVENGVNRPLNWAVYFCDFLRYQNPLREGPSAFASDANVSYKRTALESIRPVWEQTFRESSVNWTLRSRGETVALAPQVVVYQHRQRLRFSPALRERFVWGRSYAASRVAQQASNRRVFWALFAPGLPILILTRMAVMVIRKRRPFAVFLKALPLTGMLLVGWSWGEFVGYITARANSAGDSVAGGSHATSS